MEQKWMDSALSLGFSHAYPLDPARLTALPAVRDMCAADKCHAYGKNWTCPPHIGTLEKCQAEMHSYRHGILLQTVGHLKDTFDAETYMETEAQHNRMFREFSRLLRQAYPQALCLGAGGCRICGKCAWPEPCRFPEQALSSMEGYGLFVTQVCRDCGAQYHHGEKTVTYSACVLF
jgi:predicted metal-binding protein